MTITFDAAAGNKVASGTTNTWAHTVVAGQTGLLLLVAVGSGASSISGVTYNGVSLTQLGTTLSYNSGSNKLSLWYLLNPSTGTHNIVATVASTSYIAGASCSYIGCLGTFGTPATNINAGSTSSTNTVTTTSNQQRVFDYVDNSVPFVPTATASQTEREKPTSTGTALGDITATGSNMTLTWSFGSSTPWGQMSVAMNPLPVTRGITSDGYGGIFT